MYVPNSYIFFSYEHDRNVVSTNGVIYTSGFQKITQSLTYLNKPNILYPHLINVKLELNVCSLFTFISSLSLNSI